MRQLRLIFIHEWNMIALERKNNERIVRKQTVQLEMQTVGLHERARRIHR